MCSGFSISKCFKEEILTLLVLIQDGKKSDEQQSTAELWPDELTKLFRGKISKLEKIKIKKYWNLRTSNNSFHKIKSVIRKNTHN